MEHESAEALYARLRSVERRMYAMGIAWVLSLVAVGVFVLGVERAGSQSSVLTTRELRIVNSVGKTKIILSVDKEHDYPFINLISQDGYAPLISLYATTAGGKDKYETTLSELGIKNSSPFGTWSLQSIPFGPRLDIGDDTHGHAGIQLWLNEGRPYASFTDMEGYKAVLGGSDLKNQTTGTTTQKSAASLVFFNPTGKVIWSVP